MDIQRLLLPLTPAISPSGILAPAGVCYTLYEVLMTEVYLHSNGSPANHCSLAQEMTMVSRFVRKTGDVVYLADRSQSNGILIRRPLHHAF